VYMTNQYAPTRSPFFFISVVMWTMLRATLTQAAAHAKLLLSTFFASQHWDT
jgi:hypothetical protein